MINKFATVLALVFFAAVFSCKHRQGGEGQEPSEAISEELATGKAPKSSILFLVQSHDAEEAKAQIPKIRAAHGNPGSDTLTLHNMKDYLNGLEKLIANGKKYKFVYWFTHSGFQGPIFSDGQMTTDKIPIPTGGKSRNIVVMSEMYLWGLLHFVTYDDSIIWIAGCNAGSPDSVFPPFETLADSYFPTYKKEILAEFKGPLREPNPLQGLKRFRFNEGVSCYSGRTVIASEPARAYSDSLTHMLQFIASGAKRYVATGFNTADYCTVRKRVNQTDLVGFIFGNDRSVPSLCEGTFRQSCP